MSANKTENRKTAKQVFTGGLLILVLIIAVPIGVECAGRLPETVKVNAQWDDALPESMPAYCYVLADEISVVYLGEGGSSKWDRSWLYRVKGPHFEDDLTEYAAALYARYPAQEAEKQLEEYIRSAPVGKFEIKKYYSPDEPEPLYEFIFREYGIDTRQYEE